MPDEMKIAMLGPRGVGKTSLLAAMYDQFESTVGLTNLQLIPDLKSSAILAERLGELKSLVNDFEAKEGIGYTNDIRSFIFDLGKRGAKPSLSLKFQDFPGVYLDAKSPEESDKLEDYYESVKDMMEKSDAVIIAIDAPALMESRGKWHHKINRPQQIKDLFARAYQNLNSTLLVILAPVKCEKYVQNETSANKLREHIKEGYANLLNFLQSETIAPWVPCAIIPVQTVGTVVFSMIEEIDNTPHFYFHKTSHNAVYSPKDSELPLLYLLRFVLKKHNHNSDCEWGPFKFIRDWLGMQEDIKQAAKIALEACQSHDDVTLFQGDKWLKID